MLLKDCMRHGLPIERPVTFPLHPIVTTDAGPTCGCDADACSRIGKHPAVEWRDLAYGDPVKDPAPGADYGLRTGAEPKGSGVFVVDVDGPEALTEWRRLNELEGVPQPVTYSSRAWPIYRSRARTAHASDGEWSPSLLCRGTQGAG